jgi:prepilin-type processing-associated H-X9-DG protein
MNPQEFLDHVFGLLDEDDPRRDDFDRLLAREPAMTVTYTRLRQRLSVLLDDGPHPDPPPRLADRTILLVTTHRDGVSRRSRRTWFQLIPSTIPFRWTDLAVAAGIFIAGILSLLPATQRSRMQMSQIACLANLQQLGTALNRYAELHRAYPYPDPESPHAYNGAFVSMLHDEGFLENPLALYCPSSNHQSPRKNAKLVHMDELGPLHQASPAQSREAVRSDYAYHRGIFREEHRPSPVPVHLVGAIVPLLADQPPHDASGRILRGNSPNHGGGGQNVLYTDGHAAWRRHRWNHGRDRDIFLNEEGKPAPGVHLLDSVLGPSVFHLMTE